MIKGGKIFLKLMRIEDISKACQLLKSNSAKMISDSFGDDMDAEDRQNSLKNILESNSNDRFHFLAYTTKGKKLVGYAFVSNINWIKGSGELALIVDDKYTGIGYGSLINITIINYCFNELNLKKVYSKIRTDNDNIPDRIKGQLLRKVLSGNNDATGAVYTDYYYREWLKKEWIKDELIVKFCNLMNMENIY